MHVNNNSNEYARALEELFDKTPKTVLAAIAVSALTSGGDKLRMAKPYLLREWRILHENGIVPQKPPKGFTLPVLDNNDQEFTEK